MLKGVDNPNYKNGNWISESYCNCGKLKDCRAVKCIGCRKIKLTVEEIQAVILDCKGFLELSDILGVSRSSLTRFVKDNNIDFSHFKPRKRATYLRQRFILYLYRDKKWYFKEKNNR